MPAIERWSVMQHQQPQSPTHVDKLSAFMSGTAVGTIIMAGFMSPSPYWLHLARPPIILACAYTPLLLRYLFHRYKATRKPVGERAA